MSGNSIIWITWGCFILRWFTFFIIHFFVKISGLTTCMVSDVDRSDSRGRRNLICGYHNFENPKNLGTKILTSISKDSTSFSFKTPQPGFAILFWHRARPGAVLTPCNLKLTFYRNYICPSALQTLIWFLIWLSRSRFYKSKNHNKSTEPNQNLAKFETGQDCLCS